MLFPFHVSFQPEKEPSEDGYYLPDDQSNEEVLDAIGRCSVIAQLNRTRQCITLFVRSLQADPQGNCRCVTAKTITKGPVIWSRVPETTLPLR